VTKPAAVKKLLDRKEAKLTALLQADTKIPAAEKRLMELIEEQRGAFAAALASGWSAGELAELGMARRRRLYHLANKHNAGPVGLVNGAKNADGGPYEISTMG
jgi:hypothetical protein